MTSVGTLAAFAVVCLSVIWLRRTHPEIPRGYRVPLYPIVPALGIASCLWLITSVPNYVLVIFAWYTAAMIVLYFVYGMHNSELAKGHQVAATGEPALFPEDEPLDASGKPIIRP
jgi:APA family basic amino acid/polyamine antiporter